MKDYVFKKPVIVLGKTGEIVELTLQNRNKYGPLANSIYDKVENSLIPKGSILYYISEPKYKSYAIRFGSGSIFGKKWKEPFIQDLLKRDLIEPESIIEKVIKKLSEAIYNPEEIKTRIEYIRKVSGSLKSDFYKYFRCFAFSPNYMDKKIIEDGYYSGYIKENLDAGVYFNIRYKEYYAFGDVNPTATKNNYFVASYGMYVDPVNKYDWLKLIPAKPMEGEVTLYYDKNAKLVKVEK